MMAAKVFILLVEEIILSHSTIQFDGKTFHYPKIWAASDFHFNHYKIIEMCNRPFISADVMDETLIQNMREVMGRDDLLIFCGDFCYWKSRHKELFHKFMGLIPTNNIFFVLGNHDWKIRGEIAKHPKVKWCGDRLTCRVNERDCVFDHYPLSSWFKSGRGSTHYHGHIHNSPIEYMQNRINISVEMTDYKPLQIQ